MNQPDAKTPVVIVTGASSGIGEATARRFAQGGYAVAIAARRKDLLDAVAADIEQALSLIHI